MGDFERLMAKKWRERMKKIMVTPDLFCELGAMRHILVSTLFNVRGTCRNAST